MDRLPVTVAVWVFIRHTIVSGIRTGPTAPQHLWSEAAIRVRISSPQSAAEPAPAETTTHASAESKAPAESHSSTVTPAHTVAEPSTQASAEADHSSSIHIFYLSYLIRCATRRGCCGPLWYALSYRIIGTGINARAAFRAETCIDPGVVSAHRYGPSGAHAFAKSTCVASLDIYFYHSSTIYFLRDIGRDRVPAHGCKMRAALSVILEECYIQGSTEADPVS